MVTKIKNESIKKCKKIKKSFFKYIKTIYLFFKEKGKIEKLKKLFSKIKKATWNLETLSYLLIILPFVLIDLVTRFNGIDIGYYGVCRFAPRFLSVAYIGLLVYILKNTDAKYNKFIYTIFFVVFYVLFLVNNIYYCVGKNFFNFSLIGLASEGSSYFLDSIKNCNFLIYLFAIIILGIFILSFKFYPFKNTKLNIKNILITFIVFFLCRGFAILTYGSANAELTWDTWRNPRNVYNNFNDSNKSMVLTGFYEYTFRDFYVNILKPQVKKNEAESLFLEGAFSEEKDEFMNNKYTSKYEGYNVIFIQMEGIDNWLLTKDIMPNTYSLMTQSINFKNHFSFYNGGGSTFNSEFMVNTGYITPFTYNTNAYTLNKNDYPYSLANLLVKENYKVNAFHMNTKEYYSRGINYQNWGYNQYYGLKDTGLYDDSSYQLDRELINNQVFAEELFESTQPFMAYLITYSNHLPFSSSKGVCSQLLYEDYADVIKDMTKEEKKEFIAALNYGEDDCAKRQAKETDDMIGLLMQKLKDSDLYDNTIIVFYADHYLYTMSDEYLSKYKDLSNNLVNKTPFFIWTSDMKKETGINKVTSQYNILPTVLNLLGIEYNAKWYLGRDALDNNYSGITIFPDMSWYDGKVYVVDGVIKNNAYMSDEELQDKNNYVEYLIKKNDLVLKYNYFKEVN